MGADSGLRLRLLMVFRGMQRIALLTSQTHMDRERPALSAGNGLWGTGLSPTAHMQVLFEPHRDLQYCPELPPFRAYRA